MVEMRMDGKVEEDVQVVIQSSVVMSLKYTCIH